MLEFLLIISADQIQIAGNINVFVMSVFIPALVFLTHSADPRTEDFPREKVERLSRKEKRRERQQSAPPKPESDA